MSTEALRARFNVPHRLWGGAAMTVLLLAAVPADAQVVIDGQPSCRTCRIGLEHIVALGSANDPVLLGDIGPVLRLTNGGYYATSHDNNQIIEFDERGRYVRSIGRESGGPGPGEFQWIFGLARMPGDSVLVIHRRLSVLDPAGRWVRDVPRPFSITHPRDVRMLPDGRLLASQRLPMADHAGFSVHAVTTDPVRVAASFDPILPADQDQRTCTVCASRHISVTDDGFIWVAQRNRYEFRRYDGNLRLAASYAVRNSPWHPGWRQEARGTRPHPSFGGILPAGADRVLAYGWVPAANWAAQPDSARRRYETIIELVDLRAASVLATRRVAERLFALDQGLMYSRRYAPDHTIRIHIWRPEPTTGRDP